MIYARKADEYQALSVSPSYGDFDASERLFFAFSIPLLTPTTLTGISLIHSETADKALLLFLCYLPDNSLICISNSLAFIRLGGTKIPYSCCHLTDSLLIDTTHDNLRITRCFYHNSFRNREINRMRIAKRQTQHLGFHLNPISNSNQVKLFLESLANTSNHVAQQSTRSPCKRASLPIAHTRNHSHNTIIKENLHSGMNDMLERTFTTFHCYRLTFDSHINTRRDDNGNFRYSRHTLLPSRYNAQNLTTISTSPRRTICHDALRGGNNGNTQPTDYTRQRIFFPVYT
ncbi:MAG: hypothetical protein BECKG1743D_GA0114223_100049 [Candidatus Kentron sp. G]|nr:MAG: hypothetical protein BECKG1743F_GA0114225_1000215 [Candidatus Kentron sp. G]VFM95495.1 MAG: hypothetical protein BECKG1743E_GA0114224_1000511 [Candidatus Kentron sp. G]VFM97138.1 MAG: hypothetical protein BECKG1743D_GA0114223_100049 [Candidatus Kentron sp. G]